MDEIFEDSLVETDRCTKHVIAVRWSAQVDNKVFSFGDWITDETLNCMCPAGQCARLQGLRPCIL